MKVIIGFKDGTESEIDDCAQTGASHFWLAVYYPDGSVLFFPMAEVETWWQSEGAPKLYAMPEPEAPGKPN